MTSVAPVSSDGGSAKKDTTVAELQVPQTYGTKIDNIN